MVQSDIPQQNVEFLSRVVNIPVVHSAIEYATDAYIKAKVKVNKSPSRCNCFMCRYCVGLEPDAVEENMVDS